MHVLSVVNTFTHIKSIHILLVSEPLIICGVNTGKIWTVSWQCNYPKKCLQIECDFGLLWSLCMTPLLQENEKMINRDEMGLGYTAKIEGSITDSIVI